MARRQKSQSFSSELVLSGSFLWWLLNEYSQISTVQETDIRIRVNSTATSIHEYKYSQFANGQVQIFVIFDTRATLYTHLKLSGGPCGWLIGSHFYWPTLNWVVAPAAHQLGHIFSWLLLTALVVLTRSQNLLTPLKSHFSRPQQLGKAACGTPGRWLGGLAMAL
jgi:hypothetical protein